MSSISFPIRRSVDVKNSSELLFMRPNKEILPVMNQVKKAEELGVLEPEKKAAKSVEYTPEFQEVELLTDAISYFNKKSNVTIPNEGEVNHEELTQKLINILESSQQCGSVKSWNVRGQGENVSVSFDLGVDDDEKYPQECELSNASITENLNVNGKTI